MYLSQWVYWERERKNSPVRSHSIESPGFSYTFTPDRRKADSTNINTHSFYSLVYKKEEFTGKCGWFIGFSTSYLALKCFVSQQWVLSGWFAKKLYFSRFKSKLLKNPHAIVGLHIVKKGLPFSRPPSPAGDGKFVNLFLQCMLLQASLLVLICLLLLLPSVHFFLAFLVFSHLSRVLYGSDKKLLDDLTIA